MFSHSFMAIGGEYLHNPHFFGEKKALQEDGEVGGDEEDEVEPLRDGLKPAKMGLKRGDTVPKDSPFNRENDDNPLELGVSYFQTHLAKWMLKDV